MAGGLETWVSMTQEHAQDYSAAIASLLGVSVTSEVVGGAVPPHVERAWTRACDLALAHGSVHEVGETLGTVCIRFAHLGDTWSSVDTLQRTVGWDRQAAARAAAHDTDDEDDGEGRASAREAAGRFIEANCEWHMAAQIFAGCGDNRASMRLTAENSGDDLMRTPPKRPASPGSQGSPRSPPRSTRTAGPEARAARPGSSAQPHSGRAPSN